jgi:cytidine deaminase
MTGTTKNKFPGDRELVELARRTMLKAYAPYSRYRVGAALLADDGRVFLGCNVENASYGLSLCAERSAVAQAVAAGCRRFAAVAVAADSGRRASPCGACRQVLAEFNPKMRVILAGRSGPSAAASLDRLLPGRFKIADLRTNKKR